MAMSSGLPRRRRLGASSCHSGLLLVAAITFMPNAVAATTPDGLCAALRAADLLRPGTTIDLYG